MNSLSSAWQVHCQGHVVALTVDASGVRLGTPIAVAWPWSDIATVELPTPFSVRLTPAGGQPVQLGFADRTQSRDFARRLGELSGGAHAPAPVAPPALRHLPVLTLETVPGHAIVGHIGLVTANCVMSRNMFSDTGADLMSVFGGSLGGIERAIDSAVAAAHERFVHAARSVNADAVVGVRVEIASVANKAEAILMTGTAVRLRPDESPGVGS